MSSKKVYSKTSSESETHRRSSNAVISLSQFAHAKSKGTRRAIENYKQKRKSKFDRNAGLLRSYRKAMKNEGYEPGMGANRSRGNRKRSLDDAKPEQNDIDLPKPVSEINDAQMEKDTSQPKRKRRHKTDPFTKAKEMAKQSKEDQLSKEKLRSVQMKEKEEKLKKRKQRAKKLSKLTSKGQPMMKNIVEDLLDKIKSST